MASTFRVEWGSWVTFSGKARRTTCGRSSPLLEARTQVGVGLGL